MLEASLGHNARGLLFTGPHEIQARGQTQLYPNSASRGKKDSDLHLLEYGRTLGSVETKKKDVTIKGTAHGYQ